MAYQGNWLSKTLVIGIIFLFVVMSIIPSVAIDTIKEPNVPISNGKTLYVGGSGEGNYTKIQDAIDDASDGDTVFVFKGVYNECVYIGESVNSLNLIGEDKETTIINGNKDDVVELYGSRTLITGFTIRNSGEYNDGISIGGESNIITNNIIKDNNMGVNIWGKQNIISNNIIKNNEEYGLCIDGYLASDNIILDNIFEEHDSIYIASKHYYYTHKIKNNTANGKPIRCYINKRDVIVPNDTSQVILIDCFNCTVKNIDSSGLDIGILIIGDSNYNHIYENTIKDNTWAGILIESISYQYNYNNNILNNTIVDNYIGVMIDTAEHCTVYGNTIEGNRYGIRISPGSDDIPVKSPWIKDGYQPLNKGYDNNYICNNDIKNNKDIGIHLECCYLNHVYQNDITKNGIGIEIWGAYGIGGYNEIYFNNIMNNIVGILISSVVDGADYNNISKNNFIKNIRNARDYCDNQWDSNYWNNWIGFKIKLPIFQRFPKLILGGGILGLIPSSFDWHPAKEPYNIRGVI